MGRENYVQLWELHGKITAKTYAVKNYSFLTMTQEILALRLHRELILITLKSIKICYGDISLRGIFTSQNQNDNDVKIYVEREKIFTSEK